MVRKSKTHVRELSATKMEKREKIQSYCYKKMNEQGWLLLASLAFILNLNGIVSSAVTNETCACDGTTAIISGLRCIVQVINRLQKSFKGMVKCT